MQLQPLFTLRLLLWWVRRSLTHPTYYTLRDEIDRVKTIK
ncbi:hypothetical protein NSP_6760 [Nodularia spumigena CCY9414]|nr:hypothetical protein NSP_6760 [Nodularia spumigena CCY9414]